MTKSRHILRLLLFPFSLLYGCVIHVHNFLFDRHILKSTRFHLPVICIGNISAGGTGKTPTTDYLIKVLNKHYSIAVLSRGYGRKTKGFLQVTDNTTPAEIGDEPSLLHFKNQTTKIFVDEDRVDGIQKIITQQPDTQVILLDDAMQHRKVNPSLLILLTDYCHPFFSDFFLPTGNLRDQKSVYRRADIIIATKSPENLSTEKRQLFTKQLRPRHHQKVFFTSLEYLPLKHIRSDKTIDITASTEVLIATGIANPDSIVQYFSEKNIRAQLLRFKDHHDFTDKDIEFIGQNFEKIKNRNKLVVVTEKDAIKIKHLSSIQNNSFPLYVLPIQISFLFGEQQLFDANIISHIKEFKNDNPAPYEQQK